MPSSPASTPAATPSSGKTHQPSIMGRPTRAGDGLKRCSSGAGYSRRMLKQLRILPALLVLLAAPLAQAQDDPTLLRGALEAAERGQATPALPPSHPARAWVEMVALRRDIDSLPAAQAQAFLSRYAGQPVAEVFREAWLRALLK